MKHIKSAIFATIVISLIFLTFIFCENDFFKFLLVLIILCIIIILFSSIFKYLVYNSIFKQDEINFKDLIKKSWLCSFLWLLSILICLMVFGNINDNTDKLLIRIIVSLGFAFILLLLNYINLKKFEPINSINKKSFAKFYAIRFTISIIIIGSLFYINYPNEIIKLKNISDFNDKTSPIYACDSNLSYINQNITQSKGVLYAEYNETEERIVIIKKLENYQEKNLFSQFLLNKINKKYLDSSYITLKDKRLEEPTKKFEINDFKTNIIGQKTVYLYSIIKPSFLLDFATSYHYHEYKTVNCNTFGKRRREDWEQREDFNDHSLSVDLFYDKLSKCLVLVGKIHIDWT